MKKIIATLMMIAALSVSCGELEALCARGKTEQLRVEEFFGGLNRKLYVARGKGPEVLVRAHKDAIKSILQDTPGLFSPVGKNDQGQDLYDNSALAALYNFIQSARFEFLSLEYRGNAYIVDRSTGSPKGKKHIASLYFPLIKRYNTSFYNQVAEWKRIPESVDVYKQKFFPELYKYFEERR